MKDIIRIHSKKIAWIGLIIYLAVGVWYVVSVTSLYEMMGDDRRNILIWAIDNENLSFVQSIINDIKTNIYGLIHMKGRYFPLCLHSTWILGKVGESLFAYRLYITLHTFVDIILLGILVYRLEPKSDFWKIFFIISPLMLNLFIFGDGNALGSYNAMVQGVFLLMLLALNMQLSFIRADTWLRKIIFALLTAFFVLLGCLSYELAYLTIFPATVIALYEPKTQKKEGNKQIVSRICDIVYRVLPIIVMTFLVFLKYIDAGKYAEINPETAMNLQFSPIAISIIKQMSSGAPINSALFNNYLVRPKDIRMGDILYPLVGSISIVLFYIFPVRYIKRDRYWGGLLLGVSLAFPAAALISLTSKFQNEDTPPWTDWTGGWITSLLCTFGYMVIIATVVLGIRHYENAIEAGIVRRVIVGVLIALTVFLVSVYNHASSRLHGLDNGYYYDFMRNSLRDGGLVDAANDVVIISNYNVWGAEEQSQRDFFSHYGDHDVKAAYVTWHEYEDKLDVNWVYDIVYSQQNEWDIKQAIIYTGAFESDGSYQLHYPKVYVDTSRMDPHMELFYQYSRDGEIKFVSLSKDELIKMLGYDGCGFISIDHDHVLQELLMIHWEE